MYAFYYYFTMIRKTNIRNIGLIKSFRGDDLCIDLGKEFTGELKAWMKKDDDTKYYRTFNIVDNRYLKMPKEKTIDYIDIDCNKSQKIKGKWYFEVEQKNIETNICKTIYTGSIYFEDDITCSVGCELFGNSNDDEVFGDDFNNTFD